MATAYTIRNFPPDLHKLAKTVASWEEISLRELILKSLREYLKRYMESGGLLEGRELEERET